MSSSQKAQAPGQVSQCSAAAAAARWVMPCSHCCGGCWLELVRQGWIIHQSHPGCSPRCTDEQDGRPLFERSEHAPNFGSGIRLVAPAGQQAGARAVTSSRMEGRAGSAQAGSAAFHPATYAAAATAASYCGAARAPSQSANCPATAQRKPPRPADAAQRQPSDNPGQNPACPAQRSAPAQTQLKPSAPPCP